MPIDQFTFTEARGRLPTIMLPPDIQHTTIITILTWLGRIHTPILVGFPLKRKKLKSFLLADSVIAFPHNSSNLPQAFRPLRCWASYIVGLTHT